MHLCTTIQYQIKLDSIPIRTLKINLIENTNLLLMHLLILSIK